MEFDFKSLFGEILLKYQDYKHKSIAMNILKLIQKHIKTIKISCYKCNSEIFISDYFYHLIKCDVYSENLNQITEEHCLILAQCYHNGTYTQLDKNKAFYYYKYANSFDKSNIFVENQLNQLSILHHLYRN